MWVGGGRPTDPRWTPPSDAEREINFAPPYRIHITRCRRGVETAVNEQICGCPDLGSCLRARLGVTRRKGAKAPGVSPSVSHMAWFLRIRNES
eukprot:2066124-Prymnesium_polylepis.1